MTDPYGREGEGVALEPIFRQIEACGLNVSVLGINFSQVNSLNEDDQLFYWGQLLSRYNCSGRNPRNPSNPEHSPHVLLVIYYVIVMALGLAMNVCVIGTICRVRRLRTITNTFVLSLAFADLLMAGVVIPLEINELFKPQQTHMSAILDAMFTILGVASLLNLCAVTLDRYFTITNPLTYEAKVTGSHAAVVIAGIWLLSVAQECIRFAIHQQGEKLFQVIRFVFAFSVPFICVLFVNGKIYLIARRHSRQINAANPNNREGSSRSFAKKMKTARIIGLLVGTFMVTWLPYFIITVYEQLTESEGASDSTDSGSVVGSSPTSPSTEGSKSTVLVICTALASGTALFNPLLYGLLRKEMRVAILRGVKCQNINQQDLDDSTTTTKRQDEAVARH